MKAELQRLPLPFMLWQHGYTAPTQRSCNYANFGSRKKYNAVSLSVCGPQTEYEDSPKMQAIQKVINLWSRGLSQEQSFKENLLQ